MKKSLFIAALALLIGGSAMAVPIENERVYGKRTKSATYESEWKSVARIALFGDAGAATCYGCSSTLVMVSAVQASDGTWGLQVNSVPASGSVQTVGLHPSASVGIDSSRNTVQAGLLPSASVGIDASRNTVQAGLLPSASVGIDASRNTVQAGLLPSASVGIDAARNKVHPIDDGATYFQESVSHGDGKTASTTSMTCGVANGVTVTVASGAVWYDMTVNPLGIAYAMPLSSTEGVYISTVSMARAAVGDGDWCNSTKHFFFAGMDGSVKTLYVIPPPGSRNLPVSLSQLANSQAGPIQK